MGIADFFRRDDDPQRKLMRMPLRDLREKRIEIDMGLKSAFHQIEKLRAEYDRLIEAGRAVASDNEQRLLASDAKKVRQRIELHQRDFDGLKDALENIDMLIIIREGAGEKAQQVDRDLQGLTNLSAHEFSKALRSKAAEYEKSRLRMKDRDSAIAEYSEGRTMGEDDSPELAMMRRDREPTLAKAIKRPATETQPEAQKPATETVKEE